MTMLSAPFTRYMETPLNRAERILGIWPEAKAGEIIWIEPLGSRGDALIYWRKEERVTTGSRGKGACFEGSLKDFRERLLMDYEGRVANCELGSVLARQNVQYRDEYLSALRFLESLAPLTEQV